MAEDKRNKRIAELAAQGYSMNQLARKYELSPQRVHQIVKRAREEEK